MVDRNKHPLQQSASRDQVQTRLERTARGLMRDGWGKFRAGRRLIDALLFPSDIRKIRRLYTLVFGSPPHLFSPRTFNEKVQSRKLFDRASRYIGFADKIAVREFVRERVGAEFLTKILWVGRDLEEAKHRSLPNRFVIKANHGFGTNVVVKDASLLNWAETGAVVRRWLNRDWSKPTAEWQYRWIPKRLFIEEYLEGPDGCVPVDYKFFCFNGRVEMVRVDVDRFSDHMHVLLDRDFRRLPVRFCAQPLYQGDIARPICYREMREIAEQLSLGEKFVRVDLYDLGRPVFGELTLTPHSGLRRLDPKTWDERLGKLWR